MSGIGQTFEDGLIGLASLFGLGDVADRFFSYTYEGTGKIRKSATSESGYQYATRLLNAILKRVNNSKFRDRYNAKLSTLQAKLNDLQMMAPSQSFKNKIGEIARRTNANITNLNNINAKYSDYISKAEQNANSVSPLNRTQATRVSPDVEENINKDLNKSEDLVNELDTIKV